MKSDSDQTTSSRPVRLELWRQIYQRLGKDWKIALLALVLLSIASATQPVLAVIMKPLLDEGFNGSEPSYIWSIPLAVVGLMLLRGITTFGGTYLMSWVASNMLLGLRREMFERLLGMADETFRASDRGRLLNRFTIDAGNVSGLSTEVIRVIVRESLTVVALLAVLLYMSWQLTLIVLVMLPLSVLTGRYFVRRLRRINRDTINMNAELTRVVSEGIAGQRVIKLFDGYTRERERFAYVNARLRRFSMRAASADSAMSPISQFFVALSVAIVVAVALYQANHEGLTVGSFAAFMAALGQIFDPLKRLTNIAGATQRMLISAESVFSLIEDPIEQDTGTRDVAGRLRGNVQFQAVSHRYPEAAANTLESVSLSVAAGQTVALVGRSGSGKTTLVNMLPRFIEPTGGQVLIDGIDVREFRLRALRSQLSLVSQDVVLFEGTIAENVAYGIRDAVPEERVRAALEAASLLDFVDTLPEGIHTQVGSNASALSGGQRQRLAIARALIKNAPILILDEATSALDNESERQVQASLERLMAGRTTLVIAHRLSTVQKADRIIVLDRGRIAEEGTHADLLALGGLYASLYRLQFRDDDSPALRASTDPLSAADGLA
ncbi:lipid A export permease/ATP-binding protein MsbA [Castellaniella caeni]|uniref:lipid A export permease/ATP-binding protein MsbA n=1 Tax=Castellaniella caeni TaxID=266123 RepID=UPI00082EFDBA|nr:lipid A export permease/ATP-binding protein MsbA [Castellaniella caeni]